MPGVDGLLVGVLRARHVPLLASSTPKLHAARRRVGVPGVDGLLESLLRARHVPLLRQQHPELYAAIGAASACPESMACW